MLLNEILSKPIQNLKQSPRAVNDLWTTKQHNVIGVGAQSVAYLHNKFPGKVIKTVQISGTDDPSYQFLRLCLKHQNNPWFPKIYTVKQYKTNQQTDKQRSNQYDNLNIRFNDNEETPPGLQKYTLIVVTEKLTPIKENQYSVEEIGQKFGCDVAQFTNNPRFEQSHAQQSFIVGKLFENPAQRKILFQQSKDPAFKQALRLLEPLFKHYDEDMGFRNIMMRPPDQWVFIDPIQTDL